MATPVSDLRATTQAWLAYKRSSLPTSQPLLCLIGPYGLAPQHEWRYVWPQGEIPLELGGLTFTSSSFGTTRRHQDKTLKGLMDRTPVEFRDEQGGELRIWVQEDFVRGVASAIGFESWGDWERAEFTAVPFHDAPAAIAPVPGNIKGVYLAVRMGDRLFRIEAIAKTPDVARALALRYAEAIWRFRTGEK